MIKTVCYINPKTHKGFVYLPKPAFIASENDACRESKEAEGGEDYDG